VDDAEHVREREDVVTSVVMPAYNERGNVKPLVDELVPVFDDERMHPYRPFEVVIVNDGSSDGTRESITSLAANYEPVRGVFLTRNFGQSAAISAGIDQATGEFIVTMDADRQNDPRDIPDLLAELEQEHDCVSGLRRDREDPLSKRVSSAIQTRLAKLTGVDIHDFGCTLKAYRGSALRDISLYGEGHRYIPAKLHKRGYQVTEREVNHRPRTCKETKYGHARLYRGFVDLLFHLFWNRYSTRPSHLFGGFGVLFMLVGGVIGAHAVILRLVFQVPLTPRLPRLLLIVSLVLFGFQMLVFGLLAEMITKLYYRDDQPYHIRGVVENREG